MPNRSYLTGDPGQQRTIIRRWVVHQHDVLVATHLRRETRPTNGKYTHFNQHQGILMNIPIDHDTRRKLELLSNRWGISVPELAEYALFLGVDNWITDLHSPSDDRIEQVLNSRGANDSTSLNDDTSRSLAHVPHRKMRNQ
jgi:hypothetical protein